MLKRGSYILALALLALAVGLAGCKKKPKPGSGGSGDMGGDMAGDMAAMDPAGMAGMGGDMASKPPAAKGDPLLAGAKLHPGLVAAVKAAAAKCNTKERNFTYKCAEFKALQKKNLKIYQTKKNPLAVLETASVLLHDKDPKVQMITAALVGYDSSSGSGRYALQAVPQGDLGKIDKVIVKRFVVALQKATNEDIATWLAEAAALLTGKTGKMIQKLGEIAMAHQTKDVAKYYLRKSMTYAGMKAFPFVQKAVAGGKPELMVAALTGLRDMVKPAEADRKVFCPWSLKLLSHADLGVAGEAAKLMVDCKQQEDGKYIKALLAEGKKRVKAKQWKKPFVWAYRDVCFGGFFGNDKKAPGDLCQKTYKFLEWVANQKEVEPWYRGWALDMIYYQQRNKKTLKILNKYKNHKNKEIRKQVREAIKSLKENYLKKKK